MLFRNFQRLLNIVYTASENRFSHLFLTFHLRFHLDGTSRPGAFKLFVKMACGTLAGKRDILTQQVVGVRRGFCNQLDAVIHVTQRVARHKLNIVNQIVQQSGIGFGVINPTLLVVIRLGPEVAARIPRSQLHHKLFIGLIHNGDLIRRGEVSFDIQVSQELLLGIEPPKHVNRWFFSDCRGAPLLFCKERIGQR